MQAVDGPIKFQDFIASVGGGCNSQLAENFPQDFLKSPSARNFPKSRYVYEKFSKTDFNATIVDLFDKAMLPLSMLTLVKECEELFGSINTLADYQRFYLLSKAAIFHFSKYGDCGNRASYAAIRLAQIFQKTNVTVRLEAAAKVDHFTVVLTKNKNESFVYDPLTNPFLVFPSGFYNREIINTFTGQRRPGATRLQLDITEAHVAQYTRSWPKAQKLMVQLCKKDDTLSGAKSQEIATQLLKTDLYQKSLALEDTPKSRYEEVATTAVNTFKQIVAQNE